MRLGCCVLCHGYAALRILYPSVSTPFHCQYPQRCQWQTGLFFCQKAVRTWDSWMCEGERAGTLKGETMDLVLPPASACPVLRSVSCLGREAVLRGSLVCPHGLLDAPRIQGAACSLRRRFLRVVFTESGFGRLEDASLMTSRRLACC